MPAGLYVLVAYGAQDIYLTGGNPEINHFKYTLKTHAHHAKEVVIFNPEGYSGPPEKQKTNEIKFPITRIGDLLHSTNLLYTLPALKVPHHTQVDNPYSQIRWIKKPGIGLIDEIKVNVGGTEVQTLDRDRMLSIYYTDLSVDERTLYNKMIGDIPDLVSPEIGPYQRTDTITDPSGDDTTYPYTTESDTFSLPETRLRIPLLTWFTRSLEKALPVGFLTRHECVITIRTRPWRDLIQIRDTENSDWISPPSDFKLDEYLVSAWEPNPLLEGVYYFLNDTVRTQMAREEIRVPVFQLRRYTKTTAQSRSYFANSSGVETNIMANLSSVTFNLRQESNPVSRMFILARRDDFNTQNNWTRLGNWDIENIGRDGSGNIYSYTDNIIHSSTFKLNGNEIFEDLPFEYMSLYDPYVHSTGSGNSGIGCYSFGIHNTPIRSTGTVNLGRVRDPTLTVNVTPSGISPSGYDIILFIESVNWFRYRNGYAGIMYST